MKALYKTKGKGCFYHHIVDVVQWSNDWFMIDTNDEPGKIVSPASLSFTLEDFEKIAKSNPGLLFRLYIPIEVQFMTPDQQFFKVSFKKRTKYDKL